MVKWTCELVLFVCAVLVEVVAIERVAKPVVFSYSSADTPHPATISHHYKGPVGSSVEQQSQSDHAKYGMQRNGNSNIQSEEGSYESTTPYYDERTSGKYQPHSTIGSPTYDEPQQDYDYVTVNPNAHYKPTTGAYYPDSSMDITYNHQQSYVRSTGRPDLNYPSSTINYYKGRPLNSKTHRPNRMSSTIASPIHNDDHQGYDISSSSSPNGFQSTTASYYDNRPVDSSKHNYHSTTVTYYDEPSSYSYRMPPHSSSSLLYDEQNHDYDNSTNSTNVKPNGDENYHSAPEVYSPSSSTIQHDYTKDSLPSNKPVPNRFIPADDSSVATTEVPNSFELYPHQESFYQDQPELPQLTEYKSPRTSKRRIYASTTNYYEDNEELISTTPIAEFESVREKLPPIDNYPPPNPGYITRPFKNRIKNWKDPNKLGNEERATVNDGINNVSHGDKVLQQPKFFAYSSDLENDQTGDGGKRGVRLHADQAALHDTRQQDYDHQVHEDHEYQDHDDQEYDQKPDHEEDHQNEDHHKKKEEKYVKGGGQEHHAAHKASGGDKGDKGYKSVHKHSSGKKGHHEKEDHKGKYLDEKGKKGKKKEEGGHYGEHHQAEKGKKAAKYGESGEHKKGHSTKGEHNIHKKDEYMKKHEFYDEHHEGGDHEKFGGFMAAHAHKKGAKKKKGHHKSSSSHNQKGKKGHTEKGVEEDHKKSHKDAKGYDGHFAHHKKYGKKGGHKKGKKWGYSKGHKK